jgi:hypothetical protein
MKQFWGRSGIFNWWSLRSVGNLSVLKVSYPALILTPYISEYKELSEWLHINNNKIMLSAFFAGLSLAIANLLYDVFCPVIVKRFDSPNTMYRTMLEIKQLSRVAEPYDKFDASLEHCTTSYNRFAEANAVAGCGCAVFYMISVTLFGFIFADRVWIVIRGIFT